MTVQVQPTIFSYTANGITDTFAYGCLVLDADDVYVTADGVEVASGFTVTGIGDASGGSVVFSTDPAEAVKIVVQRIIALERATNYQQFGDWRATVVNQDFDRIWMALQQYEAVLGLQPGSASRALLLGAGDTVGEGAYRALANRIQDLADPVDLQDAVTKAWALELLSANITDGAGNALLQLLADTNGAGLSGFSHAQTYASGTLGAKAKNTISVKDAPFNAVADGVANDTTAVQAALNALGAAGGGTLYFPKGRYTLSAQLTYSGGPIQILGDGIEATVLKWSTVSAGFLFTMGAVADQRVNDLRVERLTLSTTAVNSGAAIYATWDDHDAVAPFGVLEDVKIIQESGGYWTHGIRLRNFADGVLRRVYAMLYGTNSTTCVFLDNGVLKPSYGVIITDSTMNGSQTCVKSTGWMESLYISNSSLVGGTDVISCDATGTPYGNPHLTITSCHLNSKRNTIKTVGWRAIQIHGTDVYHGVGSGDISGENIYIQNASNVTITGSKIETGAVATARTAIVLVDVLDFSISGNVIANMTAAAVNISGGTSKRGAITGNTIQGYNDGTRNNEGIFIGTSAGEFAISGNVIEYFVTGLSVGAPDTSIIGNTIADCTTGISSAASNVVARNNVFKSVTTKYSGSVLRDLSGALVKRATAQTIANNTDTALSFTTETYDIYPDYYASAQPTRFTVPSGVDYVRLSCSVAWTGGATGSKRIAKIGKNGSFGYDGLLWIEQPSCDWQRVTAISPVIPVVAGDYFELFVNQNSGGNLDVQGGANTWFSIEAIAN